VKWHTARYAIKSDEPDMIRSTIVALTFAAVGAATLSASAGQSPSASPQQTPPAAEQTPSSVESSSSDAQAFIAKPVPAAAYSDAELKSFAGAVVEVHRINDAYIPTLQAANTPDEEQQIEAAALREMVQAVEKEGISVEKYEQILTQAQNDRDVALRLKQPLRDALSRVWT